MSKKEEPASKQVIIDFLMDGWGIKITDDGPHGNYAELISAGFANYSNGRMSKNWKTEYYKEVIHKPIHSRFEILDL